MKEITLIFKKFWIKYDEKDFKKLFNYLSLWEIVDQDFLNKESWKNEIEVTVHTVKSPSKFIYESMEDFSSFFRVWKDSVYYNKKYARINLELLIKNISSNKITIYTNKSYKNLVRVKLDGLYPIGIHITDLLLHKFLNTGSLVVHWASVYNEKSNAGFSLIAPPDTGKTYTTYKFMETDGYKFLGEDLSMWDSKENTINCMPFTSTWWHRFSLSKISFSRVPFLWLFLTEDKKSVYDIFGKEKVQNIAPSKYIYLLEKSDSEDCIQEVTEEILPEIIRKIKVIQRNEFSYYKNPILLAYDYVNSFWLPNTIAKEDQLIEEYFNKNKIFIAKGTNYTKFYELIKEHQKNEI